MVLAHGNCADPPSAVLRPKQLAQRGLLRCSVSPWMYCSHIPSSGGGVAFFLSYLSCLGRIDRAPVQGGADGQVLTREMRSGRREPLSWYAEDLKDVQMGLVKTQRYNCPHYPARGATMMRSTLFVNPPLTNYAYLFGPSGLRPTIIYREAGRYGLSPAGPSRPWQGGSDPLLGGKD